MKKLLLLASISVLFWGCDDETQPSGGGQARIIVNCPGFIQGQETLLAGSSIGTLYLPGSTDLNSVTKGQNIAVSLNFQTSGICKNVEVKFELNGNVIDTRNLTMGGFDASSTCQDGCYKSLNFIVP